MDFSTPNFANALLQGYQTGREIKRQTGLDNALAGYAQNPGDSAAVAQIARYDPRTAIQIQGQQADQQRLQMKAQQDQMTQHREQLGIIAKLASGVTDESSYQQALAAAKSYGLDISAAPQNYDPQWVNQQRTLASILGDEQKLPGIAQELQAAGFKPGTPEFQQGLIGIINNKYAAEYLDEKGQTRRRSALNIEPPKKQIIPNRPEGLSDKDLVDQARQAIEAGADVNDVFRQLKAWGVNP